MAERQAFFDRSQQVLLEGVLGLTPVTVKDYIDYSCLSCPTRTKVIEHRAADDVKLKEIYRIDRDRDLEERKIIDPISGLTLFNLVIESKNEKIWRVAKYLADGSLITEMRNYGIEGYIVEENLISADGRARVFRETRYSQEGKIKERRDNYLVKKDVVLKVPCSVDTKSSYSLIDKCSIATVYDDDEKPIEEKATFFMKQGVSKEQVRRKLSDNTLEEITRCFDPVKRKIIRERRVIKKFLGETKGYKIIINQEARYDYGKNGAIMKTEIDHLAETELVILYRPLRFGRGMVSHIFEKKLTLHYLGTEAVEYYKRNPLSTEQSKITLTVITHPPNTSFYHLLFKPAFPVEPGWQYCHKPFSKKKEGIVEERELTYKEVIRLGEKAHAALKPFHDILQIEGEPVHGVVIQLK